MNNNSSLFYIDFCFFLNMIKNITKNCNGGTATCTEKATCKVCGEKYGGLENHNYNQTNTDSKYLDEEKIAQLSCSVYRIQKAPGFDVNDLSTIKTVITKKK